MVWSDTSNPWAAEAVDLVRAVSGGLLFGIPLLYTMEVWWIGTATSPSRVLTILLLTFLPVWLLNRTSGFRTTKHVRFPDAAMDAVETVAIGAVTAGLLLWLLGEISLSTPRAEVVGKVVYEAMPFSIGIALAQHFLRRGRDQDDEDTTAAADQPSDDDRIHATVADVGATLIGATFIAFNIAPTDEVPLIASGLGPYALVAVVAVSLVVSFCIVFVAGFSNEEQRRSQLGIFQHPISETVACYLVALLTAAVMLWYFQRLDGSAPWQETLSYVIVLGLPASVGGAAGRLAA